MKGRWLIIITIIFLITSISVEYCYSQSREEKSFETVFNNEGSSDWGISMGPGIGVAILNKKPAVISWHRIDLAIDKNYSVGLAYHAERSGQEFSRERSNGIDSTYKLRYNYFGINLKYLFFKESKLQLSIPVLVGGGFVKAMQDSGDYVLPFIIQSTSHVVVEPGLALELHAGSYFHLELGVFYRNTFGMDMELLKESDISGLTFKFGIKLGRYY